MVKKVVYYACRTCGKEFREKSDAKKCQKLGIPDHKFKVGEYIPEVDATIQELTAVRHSSGHLAAYVFDKTLQIFARKTRKVKEASLLTVIQRARQCKVCGTQFNNMEDAHNWALQGIPEFAWAEKTHVLPGLVILRLVVRRDDTGKHIPAYRVSLNRGEQPVELTQAEIKQRMSKYGPYDEDDEEV